jgi:hypothetical protein
MIIIKEFSEKNHRREVDREVSVQLINYMIFLNAKLKEIMKKMQG